MALPCSDTWLTPQRTGGSAAQEYSLILFDWGNVLLNSHSGNYTIFDARKDIANELSPDNPQKLLALFNGDDFWTLHGEELNSLIQNTLLQIESKYTVDEFKNCYLKYYRKVPWFEDVKIFVNELLKDTRFNVGILSSLCEIDLELLKENLQIDKFDYRFLSFNVGMQKTDKKLYDIIEMVTGYEDKNVLFIDDSKQNISVAKRKGWNTLLATGFDIKKICNKCYEFMDMNYKEERLYQSLIMDSILSFYD